MRQHVISRSPAQENLGQFLNAAGDVTLRAVIQIEAWAARYSERRFLRQLDERALHDLGLSQADVEREAGKAAWRR